MERDHFKTQGNTSDFNRVKITALKAIAFRRTPWLGAAA